MLSMALLKYGCNRKEMYDGDDKVSQQAVMEALRIYIFVLVFAIIIDLLIMFYALVCLFNSNLPWYVILILILLMMSPGFGFMVSLGIIIYYNVAVKGQGQSSITNKNAQNNISAKQAFMFV